MLARMRRGVLGLGVVLAGLATAGSPEKVDECPLDVDLCYRRAIELREARVRCETGRFVIDETAFSAGQHRLQGAAYGSFHSAPVAWEWLAATSAGEAWKVPAWKPMKAGATRDDLARYVQQRLALTRTFDGDGGPLSELVHTALRPEGSRLGGALVVVRGDVIYALELHPGRDDLRREDLPWGLVPWRPMWVYLPKLEPAERELVAHAKLVHLVRTDDPSTCLMNVVSGERLLTQGPTAQDRTAVVQSCSAVMDFVASETALDEVQKLFLERLTSPALEPRFKRAANPNVETLSPERVSQPLPPVPRAP
jgi:hypothetical protein